MTQADMPATKTTGTDSQDSGARRTTAVLITGAGGEVGHGLIEALSHDENVRIVALDIRELDEGMRSRCVDSFVGDICDRALLERLLSMYEINEIYHLAALLSSRAEFTPETAHEVNVGGTLNLLRLAAEQARSHGRRVKFIFPSSIAVYGLPDLNTKQQAGAVKEDEHGRPITMYGCNKLYCENLGRYYARYYRLLAQDRTSELLDFRSIRFPGLISADTMPAGGTSDYAPEMIHAAASDKAYQCFVRPDTRIPFMTMPDAINAMLALASSDAHHLSRCVYNVAAFSPSAADFRDLVTQYFPQARITFEQDEPRQAIVDSWPEDVDTSAAKDDWNFSYEHDLQTAFEHYLVPRITSRYSS